MVRNIRESESPKAATEKSATEPGSKYDDDLGTEIDFDLTGDLTGGKRKKRRRKKKKKKAFPSRRKNNRKNRTKKKALSK